MWLDEKDRQAFDEMLREAIDLELQIDAYELEVDNLDVDLDPNRVVSTVDFCAVVAAQGDQSDELGFPLFGYVKSLGCRPRRPEPEPAPDQAGDRPWICSDLQTRQNQVAIALVNAQERRARRIVEHVRHFDASTSDLRRMFALMLDHDRNAKCFDFYACQPSCADLTHAYTSYLRSFDNAHRHITWGTRLVYQNAERELLVLRHLASEVQNARNQFETRDDGGGGVASIKVAHSRFDAKESSVRAFKLGNRIKLEGRVYDPREFAAKTDELHRDELRWSVITALDKLRNEYLDNGRQRVPLPSEFTQSARTTHFSFDELNGGDYDWALLREIILTKVEEVHDAMTEAKLPIQLNSVYRNPNRSTGESRHQYGDAVDIQVFDNDNDGTRRDDWRTLERVLRKTKWSWREPRTRSGNGHVHIDWRSEDPGGENIEFEWESDDPRDALT